MNSVSGKCAFLVAFMYTSETMKEIIKLIFDMIDLMKQLESFKEKKSAFTDAVHMNFPTDAEANLILFGQSSKKIQKKREFRKQLLNLLQFVDCKFSQFYLIMTLEKQ
uniref:Uncharacterized protein n=1 Tax=Trichobilharzia regenti TaxID=157069 RepID=A0AA85IUS2_TRIRE|nr:unnamed protein product [Trichobilharzia regenti]